MTPDELHAFLHRVGWDSATLAAVLARNHRTVRRWRKGTLPIPTEEAQWLKMLAEWLAHHPPPMAQRTVLTPVPCLRGRIEQ